jgi:choline dehydrogenase
MGMQEHWDYIIVGAGSAGCALAHELATSRPDEKILVLEAGGSDRSPFIRLQAGAFRACVDHDWGYWSQPDPTRNGAKERWWKGRVLGGSSSVNSTIFVRGAAQDYDGWSRICGGAGGWSARDVMPLFRELERSDQPDAARGRDGPLHVRTVKRPHAVLDAFIQSARAVGYPFNRDYNGERQEGVAYAQLTQSRGGWRCSAARAFLRPLLGRSNLELELDALVEKIHVENGRAVGVSFRQGGQGRRQNARHIILCAGAINSPKLLMLSGIGGRQELERHGIPVVKDLPGVGRHLKEHPLTRVIYRTRVATYNLTEGLWQKFAIAAKFLVHGEGPIANVFEGVAFLKSAPMEPNPDLQLHFVSLGYLTTPDSMLVLAPYPSVLIYVNKSHPASSGHVRLASADPKEPPLIEPRLFEDRSDMDVLVRGIALVRQIMRQEPIASLLKEESEPGSPVASTEALEEYVRTHTTTANHTAGTCCMGIDEDAVVGPDLRVRGIENLWVADASIMPTLVSGNTNAACMMIGKKLGKQLIARRGA